MKEIEKINQSYIDANRIIRKDLNDKMDIYQRIQFAILIISAMTIYSEPKTETLLICSGIYLVSEISKRLEQRKAKKFSKFIDKCMDFVTLYYTVGIATPWLKNLNDKPWVVRKIPLFFKSIINSELKSFDVATLKTHVDAYLVTPK